MELTSTAQGKEISSIVLVSSKPMSGKANIISIFETENKMYATTTKIVILNNSILDLNEFYMNRYLINIGCDILLIDLLSFNY